jgi:hypothetical protein
MRWKAFLSEKTLKIQLFVVTRLNNIDQNTNTVLESVDSTFNCRIKFSLIYFCIR